MNDGYLRFVSLFGLFVLIGFCYLLSENKKAIKWQTVITGILLQLVLGLIILRTQWGYKAFDFAKEFFNALLDFTTAGSSFVFGKLTDMNSSIGFVFAFKVLPTIIFIGSLMSVLYHFGIMQVIVKAVAKVMIKVMGTSGAESLAAAANIFAGQSEAPIVIRPYIAKMTNSELLALMTGGMATVAGAVLVAYVSMGINVVHLLAASVMSAPAALVCAKLLIPETEIPETLGKATLGVDLCEEEKAVNVIDAAAIGASRGIALAMNVGGMIIAFLALVALLNGILGQIGTYIHFKEKMMLYFPTIPVLHEFSLEMILGVLFSPVALLMGVPFQDCLQVGILLGKKLVLNEFVAYVDLQQQIKMASLSPRSITLATYALCGFANFGSIGIQIAGIGTMAPSRQKDLAKLGMKSLFAGTVACLMTACIAGIFV